MARQNYQHGKRLREAAKRAKREEKAQRRAERKAGTAAPQAEGDTPDEQAVRPAEPTEP